MDKKKLLNVFLAISLVAFAVFALISVITYNAYDPPFANYPENSSVKNLCGYFGAVLSGYGLSWLGVAAFPLVVLIGAWGVLLLLRGKVANLWIKALGGVMLIMSIALVFALIDNILPNVGAIAWAGGVLGGAASSKLLENFGLAGTCVFLTFGFMTSTILLFNVSPVETVASIAKRIKDRKRARLATREKIPKKAVIKESAPEPVPSGAEPLFLPIDLLDESAEPGPDSVDNEESLKKRADALEDALAQFKVIAQVVGFETGPAITMYELELAPGTKVSKIASLSDDLAMALKAPSVRVVAPLPGKSTVGIEVPNRHRSFVRLRELLEIIQDGKVNLQDSAIPLPLGRDITGYPIYCDLAGMPHLLIAGTTGSGKSICLNSLILSILFLKSRKDLKLLLVDPKLVEFSPFKDMPHLISPVVTDVKEAQAVLEWAVNKMDERYGLLARVGVRNIAEYNKLGEKGLKKKLGASEYIDPEFYSLPFIVIIIDELADLMMVASKKVESAITRLSQKSRAVGIHLIVSTQRPSVDVVTGLIKSNLPARISFLVASKVDSRTVLDQNGAEKLLGGGDLLFMPPGTSELVRVQGTYTSDREVERVVEFLKKQARPEFSSELREWTLEAKKEERRDPMYNEAVQAVFDAGRCNEKFLQERLQITYPHAIKLLDQMAEDGIVSEHKDGTNRQILLSREDWQPLDRQKNAKQQI
ncbi:MAG: DNA translocase FtsK [Planctomycetota bacterium]|jgi:S-DNA-T family DNA segregation ATPase FtsK/SpoIIIE